MASNGFIEVNTNPNHTLPYGEKQGSFKGVFACSNRDDGFFSGESNYINHIIYTGFRYQCVEYARRFLLLTTGCVFGNCGRASEIFKFTEITHVETGEKYPLTAHHNGKTNVKPRPGDIIIYPFDEKLTPWGHVGIISYVGETRVGVIEENQFFGTFVSPSPEYSNGELCVARFLNMTYDKEADTYTLSEETDYMPSPAGWMSYETAPTRTKTFEPFNPLESMMAVRSTPFDDPRHPQIFQFILPSGIPTPGGEVRCMLGANHCGEYFVGVNTAVARILRFTLQMLFDRSALGEAFLRLPSNPLQADLSQLTADPLLDSFFEALQNVALEGEKDIDHFIDKALVNYFDIPEAWVKAMRRDFSKGGLCFTTTVSYTPNFAPEEEVKSPVTKHEGQGEVKTLFTCNPHDEVFSVAKVSFAPPRIFVSLDELKEVQSEMHQRASFMLPTHRSHSPYGFRADASRYIKEVEMRRGARTGLTIVVHQFMDSTHWQITNVLLDCCERFKYPARIISDKDLTYKDGKLMANPSEATPESPNASKAKEPFEVNFLMMFFSWEDVLKNEGGYFDALYHAAVDEASDVVFAQPIWTFLCSGVTNKVDPQYASSTCDGGFSDCKMSVNSLRFFNICRRLYALSKPTQDADKWDIEVSEYKDSCRRVRLDALVKEQPPDDLVLRSCLINFAFSASMMSSNGRILDNTNGEYDGQPCGLMHMFRITEDDG